MFEWDRHNLGKIQQHGIRREAVEEALANDPIPIYEQDADGDCASFTTVKPTVDAYSL